MIKSARRGMSAMQFLLRIANFRLFKLLHTSHSKTKSFESFGTCFQTFKARYSFQYGDLQLHKGARAILLLVNIKVVVAQNAFLL